MFHCSIIFNFQTITLGHSTTYYPQGYGLVESSNKILVNIIKNLLHDNKKSWLNKLVNALCVNKITTEKSIGMSPDQLVYGKVVVFPTSLGIHVLKMIQELEVKPNDLQRRICEIILH